MRKGSDEHTQQACTHDTSSSELRTLAARLAHRLQLGSNARLTPLESSFRNRVFRFSDEHASFLLNIHHQRKTTAAVTFENAIASHARANGISTPQFLAAASLACGARVGVYEWIDAPTLDSRQLDQRLARNAGRLLARIHLSLESFSWNQPRLHDPDRALAERASHGDDLYDTAVEVIARAELSEPLLEQSFQYVELARTLHHRTKEASSAEQITYIHGDFNARNILTTQSEWTVIDWEDAHMAAPSFDLAKAVAYLCGYPNLDRSGALSCSLLEGYLAARPLPFSELEAIGVRVWRDIACDVTWLIAAAVLNDGRIGRFIRRDLDRLSSLERLWDHGSGVSDLSNRLLLTARSTGSLRD